MYMHLCVNESSASAVTAWIISIVFEYSCVNREVWTRNQLNQSISYT